MFLSMTEDLSSKTEAILKEIVERAEAQSIFLSDKGGNIVARHMRQTHGHEDNIAALAAGSFFATQELARLIGAGNFQRVLHQGSKVSVYMQNLGPEMLLLVVFGKDSNPGLVRLFTDKACGALEEVLAKAEEAAATGVGLHFSLNTSAEAFQQAT
jgi:predicted regulator of Ras-like GTPase activity (Roadblock/LC7/MglB family)